MKKMANLARVSYFRKVMFYWVPLLSWMVLIFIISAQSRLPSHENSLLDWVFKKGTHVTEYGILFWLWWRVLYSLFENVPKSLAGAVVLSVFYAMTDEYHQTFVPGRNGQILDILIDSFGIIVGLVVVRIGNLGAVLEKRNG